MIFPQAKTGDFATFSAKNSPTNRQQCWLPPSSHTSLESSWTYGNFGTQFGGVRGGKSGARFFSTCPDRSGSLPVDCLVVSVVLNNTPKINTDSKHNFSAGPRLSYRHSSVSLLHFWDNITQTLTDSLLGDSQITVKQAHPRWRRWGCTSVA